MKYSSIVCLPNVLTGSRFLRNICYMLTLTIQPHSEQISAPLSKRRASGKRIKEDKIIMTEGRLYGRFYKTEIPTTTQLLERALRLTLEENTFNFNGKNFFQTHRGTEKRKSYWEQPLQGHPLLRASENFQRNLQKRSYPKGFLQKTNNKKNKKKALSEVSLRPPKTHPPTNTERKQKHLAVSNTVPTSGHLETNHHGKMALALKTNNC